MGIYDKLKFNQSFQTKGIHTSSACNTRISTRTIITAISYKTIGNAIFIILINIC